MFKGGKPRDAFIAQLQFICFKYINKRYKYEKVQAIKLKRKCCFFKEYVNQLNVNNYLL